MQRELYVVNFNSVIDSRLGQTAKNITKLFAEINSFTHPDQTVVLFDEIDALALDRIDSHDIREMGRATSAFIASDGRTFRTDYFVRDYQPIFKIRQGIHPQI